MPRTVAAGHEPEGLRVPGVNRFEGNIVRNAGAGVNILGYDGGNLDRAASDGSDIGVGFPALIKAVDGVEEGRPAGSVPVGAPTAALQVSGTYLVCEFADTSSPGSGAIRSRAWSFGVTDVNGRAVLKSGTLSHDRATVTLNVTAVAAPSSRYDAGANHDAAGRSTTMLTMVRP